MAVQPKGSTPGMRTSFCLPSCNAETWVSMANFCIWLYAGYSVEGSMRLARDTILESWKIDYLKALTLGMMGSNAVIV